MFITRRLCYSPFPGRGRNSTFQILGLSDQRLNPSLDVSINRRFLAVDSSYSSISLVLALIDIR